MLNQIERILYGHGDNWPLGIDVHGDEHESPFQPWPARTWPSPLMADVPGADPSSWSDAPRPAVTAYEGFDGDAYWLDGATWRHCTSGEVWHAPVNLLAAMRDAGLRS